MIIQHIFVGLLNYWLVTMLVTTSSVILLVVPLLHLLFDCCHLYFSSLLYRCLQSSHLLDVITMVEWPSTAMKIKASYVVNHQMSRAGLCWYQSPAPRLGMHYSRSRQLLIAPVKTIGAIPGTSINKSWEKPQPLPVRFIGARGEQYQSS